MVPKNISYDFNLHTSRIFMNRLAIGMSTHRLYSQIFNVLFFPNLPYLIFLISLSDPGGAFGAQHPS